MESSAGSSREPAVVDLAVRALAGSSREPAVVDLAVRALASSPIPVPACKRTFYIKV